VRCAQPRIDEYVLAGGSVLTSCTFTITGNGSFTYGASGASGCSYAIAVGPGTVTFIFPDTAAGKRPTRR
jgi:hypothetical protein